MTPYYDHAGIRIFCGDAREVLPALEPGDCIITDPVWPNSVAELAGSDDPHGLFRTAAAYFPSLAERLVVHLGVDSDPRFLLGVPASMPFIRCCSLDYALARPKGRILYGGDVAYVFGNPPPSKPGRMILPGRMVSSKPDFLRPRTKSSERKAFEGRWTVHPCPRRLEHVRWLVLWFANGKVIDPFCGIGTTLVAAKFHGLPADGIEIDERFCETAARRLDQGVLAFSDDQS